MVSVMGIKKDVCDSVKAAKKSASAAKNQYDYERLKQLRDPIWLNNRMIQDRVKGGMTPDDAIQEAAKKMKFHNDAPTDTEFSDLHDMIRDKSPQTPPTVPSGSEPKNT